MTRTDDDSPPLLALEDLQPGSQWVTTCECAKHEQLHAEACRAVLDHIRVDDGDYLVSGRWMRIARARPGGHTLHLTVTCWSAPDQAGRGTIRVQYEASATDGATVQTGMVDAFAAPHDAESAREAVLRSPAVATPEWADLLVENLACNTSFRRSGRTFDGSVGIRCDERSHVFRIYAGNIIDHSARPIRNPTFELGADGVTWLDLLRAGRNPFFAMATRGRFQVTGDRVEYLRMIRMLLSLLDAVRDVAPLTPPAPEEQ